MGKKTNKTPVDETPAEREDRLRREMRDEKKYTDPWNRYHSAPLQSVCFPGKWYYPGDLVEMGLTNGW